MSDHPTHDEAAELGFDLETMTPFWRGQYQLMVARLKHRPVTP